MPPNRNKLIKDKIRSDDKKQQYFKKIENTQYKDGTLSRSNLSKLPHVKSFDYLKKELEKKYHKTVSFTCVICAERLLYDDARVSDDELIEATNARRS